MINKCRKVTKVLVLIMLILILYPFASRWLESSKMYPSSQNNFLLSITTSEDSKCLKFISPGTFILIDSKENRVWIQTYFRKECNFSKTKISIRTSTNILEYWFGENSFINFSNAKLLSNNSIILVLTGDSLKNLSNNLLDLHINLKPNFYNYYHVYVPTTRKNRIVFVYHRTKYICSNCFLIIEGDGIRESPIERKERMKNVKKYQFDSNSFSFRFNPKDARIATIKEVWALLVVGIVSGLLATLLYEGLKEWGRLQNEYKKCKEKQNKYNLSKK